MALIPSPPAKHKGTLTACVAALVCLAIAAVCGDHGLIHVVRLRHDQKVLEHMTFDLGQRNELLRERIRRLKSDDSYIERLARERLGLVKSGEIVYRVMPSPVASSLR